MGTRARLPRSDEAECWWFSRRSPSRDESRSVFGMLDESLRNGARMEGMRTAPRPWSNSNDVHQRGTASRS